MPYPYVDGGDPSWDAFWGGRGGGSRRSVNGIKVIILQVVPGYRTCASMVRDHDHSITVSNIQRNVTPMIVRKLRAREREKEGRN